MELIWSLIFIVIVYLKRRSILTAFVFVLNTFFNNYNTSYPVFSKFLIGSTKAKGINLSDEYVYLTDKYSKMIDKQRQKNKDLKNNELNYQTKQLFKEASEKSLIAEWLENKANYMIEANIEVNNNKKTIKQVKDTFEEKFSIVSHSKCFREAEEYFRKWESE